MIFSDHDLILLIEDLYTYKRHTTIYYQIVNILQNRAFYGSIKYSVTNSLTQDDKKQITYLLINKFINK